MRQIVLDTETTGLEPAQGHRVIEIGCVEIVGRRPSGRTLHHYLNPDREIDAGAVEVHGITTAFLADKPRFGDIVGELLDFISGAELIIHNAAFDIGFLDHELRRADPALGRITERCTVLDTLLLARQFHPGQRNSLDALCKRYSIDNSKRDLHGALLDARILTDVYLAMTGGQVAMTLEAEPVEAELGQRVEEVVRLSADRPPLRVVRADPDVLAAHEACIAAGERKTGVASLWRRLEAPGSAPRSADPAGTA